MTIVDAPVPVPIILGVQEGVPPDGPHLDETEPPVPVEPGPVDLAYKVRQRVDRDGSPHGEADLNEPGHQVPGGQELAGRVRNAQRLDARQDVKLDGRMLGVQEQDGKLGVRVQDDKMRVRMLDVAVARGKPRPRKVRRRSVRVVLPVGDAIARSQSRWLWCWLSR
ncbi:MAG: hypothetical protein QM234_06425 [Acidobacteriota bacterium]|nr:hypothetical protein [Acidobacteriota bacterium]